MSSAAAETTAPHTAAGIKGRRIATGRLREGPEIAGVIDRSVSIRCPGTTDMRIICRGGGHSRAIHYISAGGSNTGVGQPVAVSGRIERSQVRINGAGTFACYNNGCAIIGIVEIWVIPAVPDKIVVPEQIGIAKPETHAEGGTEKGAITHSVIGRKAAVAHPVTHPIACTIIGGRGVVGVVGVVVVKIGPAVRVLDLHLHILVIRGGGHIIGATAFAVAGRIHVGGILRILRRRAAGQSGQCGNSQQGKGI